jgi:hypothetical protein
LAAPPDGISVPAFPGIDDAIFQESAVRALHSAGLLIK